MAGRSFDEIVSFFDQHIATSGKRFYSDFYVGITNDVNRRLFHEHNVDRETMWWAYSTADSKETAQKVEEHYLGMGMKGSTGGGTDGSRVVYCYAVTPTTIDGASENG